MPPVFGKENLTPVRYNRFQAVGLSEGVTAYLFASLTNLLSHTKVVQRAGRLLIYPSQSFSSRLLAQAGFFVGR